MNFVGTWGLYQCFKGVDDEMVKPDCREEFFSLQPNGKVFHCLSAHGDMLDLAYGKMVFQVNSKLYREVKEPFYKLGESVKIVGDSSNGRIAEVNWHIKNDCPFYFVEISGKTLKKRYFDCDLQHALSD